MSSAWLLSPSSEIATETYAPKGVDITETIKSDSETKPGIASAEGGAPIAGGSRKSETITYGRAFGKTIKPLFNSRFGIEHRKAVVVLSRENKISHACPLN